MDQTLCWRSQILSRLWKRFVESLIINLLNIYKVFLNDLPGNDFNNVFRSLDTFKENLQAEMETEMVPCYFFGVPGSFYGRIFPNKSLHFVHSSYSLKFLSKVPDGVDNNKGNIYLASTSPSSVIKAYYEQYRKDFSFFLKCRALELVEGGSLVLTFIGKKKRRSIKQRVLLRLGSYGYGS
ncbi:putative salicylate carboxymethyltransferase [Medicago truncatula]|uniref:Putative salicylate carboxymethyltransferase n=1 Tax=Medicago truncatula TaxID=3880 RepID=A0A396GLT2_MEDTR|nr:putative salicylate carboxymethyltransferase [Medicago truncatula]